VRDLGAWCIAAALLSAPAAAQEFPTKPIRIIVPFAPGGADVSLRLMQNHLQEQLGQPIIIDNRPGASGFVGAEMVAHAAPDGYTLLHTSSSTLVQAPLIMKNAPFDPVRDFTPITRVFTAIRAIVVKKSLPAGSLQELIAAAKREPGKLTYASNGIGSGQHLDGETFKLAAGVDLTHVAYKGVGPIVQALLAQEVDISFSSVQAVTPVLADVKVLALYDGRPADLANVPPVSEVVPGFHTPPVWVGMFAPAGLPPAVLARLNAAAVAALRSADVATRIEQLADVIGANAPDAFAAEIRADIGATAALVKTLEAHGIRFE
jgi:tripartite-type tricarboxylate transporter receptor subunit TctC